MPFNFPAPLSLIFAISQLQCIHFGQLVVRIDRLQLVPVMPRKVEPLFWGVQL